MDSSDPAPSRALRGAEVLADPLVRELLGLRLVAVLGTIGRGGLPHLTPVWFADDGDAVLVATSSTSRKIANIERDPRATIVLHDSRPGFEVCGASITGSVEVVVGMTAAPLVERVHARYVGAGGLRLREVSGFLAADDVAVRLVPEHAWTWDQRGTPADRAVAASGEALPLSERERRG